MAISTAPQVLTDPAAVLEAAGGHPMCRSSVRVGTGWMQRAWRLDGAVAWVGVDEPERTAYLHVMGPLRASAALVDAVADEASSCVRSAADRLRLTGPRDVARSLRGAWQVPEPVDWEMRWLISPTGQLPGPGMSVGWLDDDDAIAAFLAEASPHASIKPGDPYAVRWAALHREGQLLAVAADVTEPDRVGRIASVATHPDHRGRGLGGQITGWLADQLLVSLEVVTLELYANNQAARRTYDRIGFRDVFEATSGGLDLQATP